METNDKRESLEIGNLVIHSGSYFEHGIGCVSKYGIILNIDGPQIDFGRRRCILVQWDLGQAISQQTWEAPRNIYLVRDVVLEHKKQSIGSFKLDCEYLEEEYVKTLKLSKWDNENWR